MTTQNPANRPRALIAMSGGVDSSVAACLMQQAGYDCTGITMRLTHNETLGQSGYQTCCSEKDIEDAAEVAFALDMPYQVLDFTADFRAQIIEKFIRVYEAGGTPNPCIDCNKYMKFRHLLDWAEEHGMEYVVTGHYARVEQDAAACRWVRCTRLRYERSRRSTALSTPKSTTVRISALCRTATMPALWSSLPASTTLPGIFWIGAAR